MVIIGILFIVGAFSCFGYGELTEGLAAAAIGSCLIAYGIHRKKQAKQKQSQQQTVVINNYTMPQQDSTAQKTVAEITEQNRERAEQTNIRNTRVDEKLEEIYRKRGYPYKLYLQPEDLEMQKKLLEFKLNNEDRGYHYDCEITGENGCYHLICDKTDFGCFDCDYGAWLEDHFEDISTIEGMRIWGGDTDDKACFRPLTIEVRVKLNPGITPPEEKQVPLPPSAIYRHGLHGDAVVLVSRTGKIHKSSAPCGVIASRCTPMLYAEAIADGREECANCFR